MSETSSEQHVERHPWSRDFEWRDHIAPFTTLTASQVTEFDHRGFTLLTDVFSPEEIRPVREAIDVFEARVNEQLAESGDDGMNERGAMSFVPNVSQQSEVLASVVHHPVLVGAARDLLGPDVDLYWDQAVYKRPERPRRFPLHQDTGYQMTDPEDFLSCWIALNDATPENGCLSFALGMHRHGTLRHVHVEPQGWEECLVNDSPELVTVPAPIGSVVVFSSLTPHLTGPNTTDKVRKGYLVLYTRADTVILSGSPEGDPERTPVDPRAAVPVLRSNNVVP